MAGNEEEGPGLLALRRTGWVVTRKTAWYGS